MNVHHIRKNFTDTTVNRAYWLGVYVTRRQLWMYKARLNKAGGFTEAMEHAVKTAKEYHGMLMKTIRELEIRGAFYN